MNILSSWLREFVQPEVSSAELAHTLTMSGLEVDGVHKVAPEFNGVVVGEVVSCEKHPNADKLNLCQVNIGSETLQIICGAKNVRAGLKVAVATIGSILPGDFKIKKAKLRGVESCGMICSESELGLTDSSEGIMELALDTPIGGNIRDVLNLDDEVIEIDITPNRGDCFSLLGVAREVSVNYSLPLLTQEIVIADISSNAIINTRVEAPQHCPKYLVRVIENIDNTRPTPDWMAKKLTRSGFATHSAIVDITNFVLLELGQPMHGFDYAKINGTIAVRLAKAGEQITLLNEDAVTLNDDTLVIADEIEALAIAGIMGGLQSSITPETTSIVLESAFFDNVAIAGKARSYGLHTESSLRFERGVDYNLAETAMARATELVLEICGGNAAEIVSAIASKHLPARPEISVRFARIHQVLGFELDKEWIIEKFQLLSLEITRVDEESISVIPPSFRFDIAIAEDLIEELARIYGYDKIPTKALTLNTSLQGVRTSQYDAMNTLVACGYSEVINYSFISKELAALFGGNIALLNPISSDLTTMRTSLLAGLAKTVLHNKRYGQHNLKLFEVGLCFEGEEADKQVVKIAGLLTGNTPPHYLDKERAWDFYDIKADIETLIGTDFTLVVSENDILQPGQRADIIIGGETVGYVGALHPRITKALGMAKSFVFEMILTPLLKTNIIKYKSFSNYQVSKRDISLLLESKYQYQEILNAIATLKQQYLIQVELLDIWKNEEMEEGYHSMTLSLSYQAEDKTLTDEEIQNLVNEVLVVVLKQFNAQQR